MTDYTDLVARLRAACTPAFTLPGKAADAIESLSAELARVRAERAPPSADARDAARYQWLRGGPDVPQHSLRWPRWEVRHWDGRFWNTMFAEHIDSGIDRDAAIDAATGKGEAS